MDIIIIMAKGSALIRLNFGMCQNVSLWGLLQVTLLLQTCTVPAVQNVPFLPEAGQETAPCLPTLNLAVLIHACDCQA